MNTERSTVDIELSRRFLADHPYEAAAALEALEPEAALASIRGIPESELLLTFRRMTPDALARLLEAASADLVAAVLGGVPGPEAVRVLGHVDAERREQILGCVDEPIRRELEALLAWPADSAGRFMDTAVQTFRRGLTIDALLGRLRARGIRTAGSLFLVDDDLRLTGRVRLEDVILASPDTTLAELERPVDATVRPMDPLAEVALAFQSRHLLDLAVIDLDGFFLGAVTHEALAGTIQQEATAGLQTMVGAGKEERALSGPLFAVKKRMPWLQINLATAFLAAAVVGIFEATIAQVTALAVLLPVVAGQSGNTGAQALAVTMRGLALREISVRHWSLVLRKEVIAALLNGIAVAITCGVGVYVWSGSPGLVAVIMCSMVLAMMAAGFAGAVIPVILTRLGQDPATSSSIILTTVTDVAGFFAFLGIASMMMSYL